MGLHGLACWMGKYWSLDRDIAFLEIIPIAFSIFLWHKLLDKNLIVYSIDNVAVVSILESKTSKSARIMVLFIFIVYWLFVWHLHFKALHISYVHNAIADSLSRGQFQDQRASSDCRTEANDDTLGMLEPFKTEFYSLIYKSISKKTWKVYKNAKNTLEEFREFFLFIFKFKFKPTMASSYYSYN